MVRTEMMAVARKVLKEFNKTYGKKVNGSLGAYDNCREQGYSIQVWKGFGRKVMFSECRNSDAIIIRPSDGDIGYYNEVHVDAGNYKKAARIVYNMLSCSDKVYKEKYQKPGQEAYEANKKKNAEYEIYSAFRTVNEELAKQGKAKIFNPYTYDNGLSLKTQAVKNYFKYNDNSNENCWNVKVNGKEIVFPTKGKASKFVKEYNNLLAEEKNGTRMNTVEDFIEKTKKEIKTR